MKAIRLLRDTALILACYLSAAAPATAGVWDIFKSEQPSLIVADPFVDMRTGPGRGFPVFHVIEKGDELRIIKRRTDWFKAQTNNGVQGWVKRDDLNKTLGPDGQSIAFSNPGREDYVDRRWEMGFLGGDFESSDALTTYLGLHFTPHISSELKYTQTFSSVANNKLFSINIVHKPFPNWRVAPFFTLGAGEIKIAPSSVLVQNPERENPVYTVGGGAFIYISRRFLFRMEFNNHTLLTSRPENEEVDEWKAGFSVFF